MDEKFFVCIYICNKDVESELINDELASSLSVQFLTISIRS